MERIGNYREDGKRYQQFSLKKMDMNTARLAQKVSVQAEAPVLPLLFPDPQWGFDTAIRMEDVSFGYSVDDPLLSNITLQIGKGDKIAVVGKNGCGKSTLVKMIVGDLPSALWRHPNLRIGYINQYSVEELDDYANLTVTEFAEKHIAGRAKDEILAKASSNIRQYLGGFGMGGSRYANREIRKLSGGERMRLCFARALADLPHLLLLDESTNHVDLETLQVMGDALNKYQGAVFMVSHNQDFLSRFCKQL